MLWFVALRVLSALPRATVLAVTARLTFCLAAVALTVSGCSRDLLLPPVPPPPTVPIIVAFEPALAFGGDRVVVFAQNPDELGNQLVFPGGSTALAERAQGRDVRLDGGLVFVVPDGLARAGPLVLSTTQGRSEPSTDEFSPLGTGHPSKGTSVAQLRFRLNPVGVVDREENVLMATSIFDLVLTDGKAFNRVPGRPLAIRPSPTVDRSLVSVRTEGGGLLLEVDSANGTVLATSLESDTRELFILPPLDGQSLARTLGVDQRGRTWLSTWKNQASTLMPTRRVLPFTEILGAAASGSLVMVIARGSTQADASPAVYTLTPLQVTRTWAPTTGSACITPIGTATECRPPDGPMAIVPSATPGAPTVVVSLISGDLLLLDGAGVRFVTLISYAPIDALAPGVAPGKVLLTKAHDGALFQYDLVTEELDWSVQLRGEPTVLDVAPGIDEIAIGNRADNAVDIVTASTGQWVGRIAFDLGLGSVGATPGGVVAAYSNDRSKYPPKTVIEPRMDLLMRNVGLVASIDATSLDVIDHVVLDPTASEPLRLVVTSDLKTLVVHQRKLGLLEAPGVGLPRVEHIVTAEDMPAPIDVHVLPSGPVVVSSLTSVRWYRWISTSASRALALGGEFPLPDGATLVGSALHGEEVLVVWTSGSALGGGFYSKEALRPGGTPSKALTFDPALSDFLGVVTLREGPALLFGRLGTQGPAAVLVDALRSDGPSVPSVINRRAVTGASPDGRYVVWLDEGGDQPVAKLVRVDPSKGLSGYAIYRLGGHAAGPGFDATGQLLFLPVPALDEVDVVE